MTCSGKMLYSVRHEHEEGVVVLTLHPMPRSMDSLLHCTSDTVEHPAVVFQPHYALIFALHHKDISLIKQCSVTDVRRVYSVHYLCRALVILSTNINNDIIFDC
jgi:hypothetical protein